MTYPFKLMQLPYSYCALEPHIDAKTMEIHHSKHLQAYVDNLNNILKNYPKYHNWTLKRLLLENSNLPKEIQVPVKNNAGGIFNHDFYFQMLSPCSSPLAEGGLKTAIEAKWGSVKAFLDEFLAVGMSVFGSGWVYLVASQKGELSIYKSANQDTFLPMHYRGVLVMDVWEHAYYLKNQNRRNEYIESYFKVINWELAQANY